MPWAPGRFATGSCGMVWEKAASGERREENGEEQITTAMLAVRPARVFEQTAFQAGR